jgi:exonuclease III
MSVNSRLKIDVMSINVNSFNISTFDSRSSKCLLKIEGVTSKKADVIFISDVRAKDKGEELKKLFCMTRNGSYKLYLNSSRESRGVAIAIKRGIFHEVRGTVLDRVDENYIIMDVNFKGHNLTLGCIYGPNGNNPRFFRDISDHIQRIGGNFIIGGDMNTILCNDIGPLNVDRIGDGRVPNVLNLRVINEWIRDGFAVDPFRALYPEVQEISYIPFRSKYKVGDTDNKIYSRTRLDFFLVTPGLLDGISSVKYEDRLGADFDHKGVTLKMGKKHKGGKINIFESTLGDTVSLPAGIMSVYDTVNNHLVEQNVDITNNVTQLDILIREAELVKILMSREGCTEELERRRVTVENNIGVVMGRFPDMSNLMKGEFSCSYRQLYEMIMKGIKNVLVAIQNRRTKEQSATRDFLINRINYMEGKFGANSTQAMDTREHLLRFDDILLKERATKFREFLDANNEQATKAFCRLSKEGGINDDLSQIKNSDGEAFGSDQQRGDYIKTFYENLYRKRLDTLLSVEDFLGNETGGADWVRNRKLSQAEKNELEGLVTLDELQKAFDESNLNSSSGWDGMSYRVIGKFWGFLRDPMLKMINETFEEGELMESFKLGIIKVIPKKGNAERLGDWRPITLLCCGYTVR